MRYHSHRPDKSHLVAKLHRGLRPKLSALQVRDLSMAHHANLDAIAKGDGNEGILWQWVGGLLTWSRAAVIMQLGIDEIAPQLELAASLVDRYARTGRIGFSGAEYQAAKTGVMVMDAIAEAVDRPTAIEASYWSEECINALAAMPAPVASSALAATQSQLIAESKS